MSSTTRHHARAAVLSRLVSSTQRMTATVMISSRAAAAVTCGRYSHRASTVSRSWPSAPGRVVSHGHYPTGAVARPGFRPHSHRQREWFALRVRVLHTAIAAWEAPGLQPRGLALPEWFALRLQVLHTP